MNLLIVLGAVAAAWVASATLVRIERAYYREPRPRWGKPFMLIGRGLTVVQKVMGTHHH